MQRIIVLIVSEAGAQNRTLEEVFSSNGFRVERICRRSLKKTLREKGDTVASVVFDIHTEADGKGRKKRHALIRDVKKIGYRIRLICAVRSEFCPVQVCRNGCGKVINPHSSLSMLRESVERLMEDSIPI